MIGRTAVALLLCASLLAGVVSANPATQPSAAAKSKFPTPGELVDKWKADEAVEAKKAKVALFDLDQPITEKEPEFSLFGGSNTITVHSLIDRLHTAREDKNLRAVVMVLGSTNFNLAQAQEIRTALNDIRKAGKRTFVYSDAYDTAGYTAASGATDVCLLAGGELELPGVGLQTMFLKGLFDKVGVKADYVQIGEYKGADEEFTRTEASEELKGELNKIVESLYSQIVGDIAQNRNLAPEAVKALIDEAIITSKTAKERGLVDHLIDRDDLSDLVKTELGNDISVVKNYGLGTREKIDMTNPWAIFSLMTKRSPESTKPAIAVIHAEGVIVDGETGQGLFGGDGNIGGENMRKAFRLAARDENVKAIVLRIDSPGGSALASEVMWQAARHAAAGKPLIVSIGSMAASGGYYLASSGDYIFADPSAIVGSIGVVGGKFVLKGIFDKLGIATETFSRGQNSGMFGSEKPFTDRQRRQVTNWMKQTYDQFTERVMTHRKGKIKDIDQVARGRIFIAKEARELGMVDELGGIEDAIRFAAKQVDLKPGAYEVKSVPPSRTLGDLLSGNVDEAEAAMHFRPQMTLQVSADSVLRLLPSDTRKMLGQQLQFMTMLEQRPILLVSPYVITVK